MNLDLLRAELERDEGVRRMPYKDSAGIMTVGIGYNLEANPLPSGITFPLSDNEINELYTISVQNVCAHLDHSLPWWAKLDEVRQRVVANMAFNLGIGKLSTFVHTLSDMEQGDYVAAAEGMRNSLWFKQVGQRAVRLANAMEIGEM